MATFSVAGLKLDKLFTSLGLSVEIANLLDKFIQSLESETDRSKPLEQILKLYEAHLKVLFEPQFIETMRKEYGDQYLGYSLIFIEQLFKHTLKVLLEVNKIEASKSKV